ncbi:MAG: cation transporter [Burkholderiales bacterium]
MSTCCSPKPPAADRAYRKVLAIALTLNASMFFLELVAGIAARSTSLLADAADFAGDAGNYALSLGVLAFAPALRSRVALVKGLSMGAYGLGILSLAAWNLGRGTLPEPAAMGAVGLLALAVNVGVAAMLYRYRTGDADMRSVWLCSRNDAIGNVAVMLAAAGVFGTGSGWPDQLVAAIMATLALVASVSVVRQARREILESRCASAN